ncbi:hypothetical protein CF651_11970 [Paenibacillus rigui]|uniref:Uncharacterized protein n=1 Tax=Paenibacillus rigui TaxID=554312 RepID=A0A229US63_9BACL|nr:hypothetical protein CF651_11970 [Paenibacillus rigui]
MDWGDKEWGTHRFHIRQLIEHSIGLLKVKDQVIVLGAGTHGDVDLPGLTEHFTEVTVMDTEDNVIEEVIGQSGGLASGRIKSFTNIDYTGLDQIQFYETWEEMLLNQAPAAEMAAFIRESAFRAKRNDVLPQWKKSFSLVISSSVHTQLFYIHALTQFAGYASQYAEQDIRQIIDALSALRNSLVTDYNRLLLSLLKPDGRVIMWSDMIRLDSSNQALLDGLYGLQTEDERIRYLFRAFGQYGMEAAVLGLKDFHDQLSPSTQMFKCWVWLQSPEKQYITAGFSASPRG